MIKKLILTLCITFTFCKSQETKIYTVLDVDVFKTEVVDKNIQLVDVRTAQEYEKGHLENAINIDFFEEIIFSEKFKKLDKNKAIYIYCRSGARSSKSAIKLEKMGFTKIYDLQGGYIAWKEKGN